MAWATIDQVADLTGVTADARMERSLDVALAWCNRKRPDLNPYTEPAADVSEAVVLFASLLWRGRATPQGFATDPGNGGEIDAFDAMQQVRRLLGVGKPVAR